MEDFDGPILPGEGASDYERYLRTDELLFLVGVDNAHGNATGCLDQLNRVAAETAGICVRVRANPPAFVSRCVPMWRAFV